MQAHASQATSDLGPRTLALLLRIPGPVFAVVAGWQWFVQRGRSAGNRDDIFSPT